MKENINCVAEFHKTTGSPVLKEPKIPGYNRIDLRLELLEEEVKELGQAAFKGDLIGVLDALCDIQYVLHGTVLEFGMQDIFEEACSEVHASNMSKFCPDTQSAKKAADHYTFRKKVEATYKKVGKNFVILRSADDKILKGLNYFEPRLKEIIKKHLIEKQSEKS